MSSRGSSNSRKAPAKKVVKKAAKSAARKTAPKKAVSKKSTPKKVRSGKKPTKKTATKKATKKTVSTPLPRRKTMEEKMAERSRMRGPQAMGHLYVEQMLRDAKFAGGISTDKEFLDAYAHDESIFSIRPQVVLQPKHQKDVEIAVKVIAAHTKKFPALSLTPRAAGTGLSGGSLTDSIVIDVSSHLTTISEPKRTKHSVMVTVEPGVMLRDLEKKLKTYGAYLPASPASKDICAIGGCIGNNAAGADTLRYGHFANSVESLDVVLRDGQTYTIQPLSRKEFTSLVKKKNAYAEIATAVFDLLKKNEAAIKKAKPKTSKNTAGYALWDVIDGSVKEFEEGNAHFDLTRLICGSQGSIGIITSITLRADFIPENTSLVAVPVFNLQDAGKVIQKALAFDPINVELYDGLTFDLALQNPGFFKDRLPATLYYRVLVSMYTTYHVRYLRKVPEFTLLITIDNDAAKDMNITPRAIAREMRKSLKVQARHVAKPVEREMFWQIRRASYSLSKFGDPTKRPAAFLEDMTVSPEHLGPFFKDVKNLLEKFDTKAAVHGHGGDGHLHFYPLLDFTDTKTAEKVEAMTEAFFKVAVKHKGNICGEHNDGIIRTPHLSKIFTKKAIGLFETLEHIFDPDDIFNPGKKVNPKFDIKESLRKTN